MNGENSIVKDVEAFLVALNTIKAKLEKNYEERERGTENILELLKKPLHEMRIYQDLPLSMSARQLLENQIKEWETCIANFEKKSRESSEAQKNLSIFPKELVIAVFGRTNSGKSTFGNFIKGRYLQAADFSNAYRAEGDNAPALPCSSIRILEDASNFKEEQGTEWFREGIVETTSEAQVFTMPGVAWMDTPGIGSITEGFGDLAKKYAEHTDVLLYLDSSDSPGLRDHAHVLKSFLEKGCPTWVLINRSDCLGKAKKAGRGYLRDEKGEYVKKWQAKPAKDRKAQEEQEVIALTSAFEQDIQDGKRSKDAEFLYIVNNVKVTSISGNLARLAVLENDNAEREAYWKQSNMSHVYRVFEELAQHPNLVRFKKAEGYRTNQTILNMILHGDTTEAEPFGLEHIAMSFHEKIAALVNISEAFDIEKETERVVDSIMAQLAHDISATVEQSIENAEHATSNQNNKSSVAMGELMQKAEATMQSNARIRVAQMLKEIFDEASAPPSMNTAVVSDVHMKRQTETREFTYHETESYERSPSGFRERFGSVFGKKYYGYSKVERTETQVIDHGFDPATVRKDMTDAIRQSSAKYVQQELANLKQHYLGVYIDVLQKGLTAITEAIDSLKKQRDNISKELKELC